MSRTASSLGALSVGAVALIAAAWFDSVVMADARRQAASSFDSTGVAALLALGSIAVGGACLAIGWVGWRADAVVGIAYAIVGGFFSVLPWMFVVPAGSRNGAPPLLPDPIPSALGHIYTWTNGPLNAVGTIGGAMLIVGLLAIIRSWRLHGRAVAGSSVAAEPSTS